MTLVTYSHQVSPLLVIDEPCFGDTLSYASTQTKFLIRNVLENLGTQCGTSRSCAVRSTSRYSSGLWKAFQFMRNSDRERTSVSNHASFNN